MSIRIIFSLVLAFFVAIGFALLFYSRAVMRDSAISQIRHDFSLAFQDASQDLYPNPGICLGVRQASPDDHCTSRTVQSPINAESPGCGVSVYSQIELRSDFHSTIYFFIGGSDGVLAESNSSNMSLSEAQSIADDAVESLSRLYQINDHNTSVCENFYVTSIMGTLP